MRSALTCLVVLALAACPVANSPFHAAPSASVPDWIRSQAVPFESCEPDSVPAPWPALERMVGRARLVALGDCTRGTHESFRLKHALVQYLATHMGFTTLVIEAPMAEVRNLDAYVSGGRGDARTLIAGFNHWIWDQEEFVELVEWMRAYNAAGRGRLHIAGLSPTKTNAAEADLKAYLARVDSSALDTLNAALTASRRALRSRSSFVSSSAYFPARAVAGHHLRFSGWIKTQDVVGGAILWWRGDAGTAPVAFDNMSKQPVDGTRDWQRYAIDLDIPANADSVQFGMILNGTGRAWYDSLAIEIDGRPWSDPQQFDLALEEPGGPLGFLKEAPPAYRIAMDDSVARFGRRSLCLSSRPASEVQSSTTLWADAEARSKSLLDLVCSLRKKGVRIAGVEAADWAEQDARIVLQNIRTRIDQSEVATSSSQAANVEWLMARAPAKSKFVLWGHNAVVGRYPGSLGQRLADRLGRDLVVVGFTTHEGQYTASKQRERAAFDLLPGPAGSIDSLAAASGLPRFLLDLRPARRQPALLRELSAGLTIRALGVLGTDDQFAPASPATEFDVLAFVRRTTASRAIRH